MYTWQNWYEWGINSFQFNLTYKNELIDNEMNAVSQSVHEKEIM